MSYQGHAKVLTTVSWWTNEMRHINLVQGKKKVLSTNDGTSGHSHILRPNVKAFVWIKEFIRDITSPAQSVLTHVQVAVLQ